MRSLSKSIISFVLGAPCTFLVMRQGVVSAQIYNPSAIPVVPGIIDIVDGALIISPVEYPLDGIATNHATFAKGVTFTYGGGAYRLENSLISGPV